MTEQTADYIELAADIVSAYVSNNTVAASDLPALIRDVHSALVRIQTPPAAPAPEPQKPAVNARRSVQEDFIICLEDGKKFKSLKRHLRTQYNMTPEQYREKWSLPPDYPMVAPNYAKARSALAKEMGLGQARKKPRR
jgi:predicted transcriptional regulator